MKKSNENRTNDLKDLRRIVGSHLQGQSDKEIYQEEWAKNKYLHRKMVAKKNRKWLQSNISPSEFTILSESDNFGDYPTIRENIENLFNDEKSRKWIIHLITNFLPLNRAKQAPKIPKDKSKFCQLSNFELTDVQSIIHSNRDKHIAFTGHQTSNLICGIALNELYKFVIDYTYNFNTKEGQIINYALDVLREKSK